ncbi:MAG: hypothetical protein AB1656_06110 [Candidatus Omnitrophota bacterium]
MKNLIKNKNRKRIFFVLSASLLLPLILQLHTYAVYYSCDARCFSWLCQNIPNNSWYQVVGNGWGDVYDGIQSSWYCRYCYAKIYNFTGSTQSFCTTVVPSNEGICANCSFSSSTCPVTEVDYKLDDAKDNYVYYSTINRIRFTCNGAFVTGSCPAPNPYDLGFCP